MKNLTPMKNFGPFNTMDVESMRQVNGGGFAYDVGRGIRCLALYVVYGNIYAMTDYIVNEALNEAANN
ncbi:MAG TPA: hypothetical protein ENO20_09160 [Bacteroides sp.]|nr:hypothetical protein [Bacteroides sp.]